jgi:protocatechuate 3,4-dioxygenase alpha subunit
VSRLHPTPGQTVGPFFGYALPYDRGHELVPPGHPGAKQLHGTVYDGAGAPVPDALLELWQPNADGTVVQQPGSLHRDGFTFTGWGRAATDNAGHYSFTTVEPGPVDGARGFFAITVFARGLLDRLFTRAYLDPNAPFLASLPADRRDTLLVQREHGALRFDLHLQGPRETVFLRHSGHTGLHG